MPPVPAFDPNTLVVWSTALAAALGILGTAVALFLSRVRKAWNESGEQKLMRATSQRDAMIEGHARLLADLEERDPITAAKIRATLRQAQVDYGVQSDVAPLVDQAKRAISTPPPPGNALPPPPATGGSP